MDLMTRHNDTRINLLHLVQTLEVGGAETLLLQTIPALGMKHYQHFVYCFGPKGPISGKIENLGVPIVLGPKPSSIKSPGKFVFNLIRLRRHLSNFIKKHRIDIVQSHLGRPNQLGVVIGKLSGVHVYPTVHNTIELVDTRSKWDFRVYILKLVNEIIYRLAGRIVVVSEEVKKITRQKYNLRDHKIIVLKNGIIFNDHVHSPIDLSKEFPGSSNKLKILAVGRLTHQKAFEVLVKAVAEVIKSGQKDLFVMIAGEGEERLKLETLITNMSLETHIKLLGIRHDIMGLMKASDLFVMPSRYEGLSIAMIEAMACGLPIIASDAPGLRDNIVEGQNGLLFPLEDNKALARIICKLANKKALIKKLSGGARESFWREYDMRKNIAPLDMHIQSMVSTHKARKKY